MSTFAFETAFERLVDPQLRVFGFRQIAPPDGWIAPARLYERTNTWFATSWDWRDLYLDVALGRLFRFRDVLPRAIVRGPYRRSVTCPRDDVDRFLAAELEHVVQELPQQLEHLEERLPQALIADRTAPLGATKQDRQVVAEYAARLGRQLSLEDWKGSRVV